MGDFYTSAAWRKLRKAVLARDGNVCARCGRPGTKKRPLHIHHQIPRSQGGEDAEWNLSARCKGCHAKEHPSNALLAPASTRGPLVALARLRALRHEGDEGT